MINKKYNYNHFPNLVSLKQVVLQYHLELKDQFNNHKINKQRTI